MALINYIEPVSIGEVFSGIGILVLLLALAWIFIKIYGKIADFVNLHINKEAKYQILEEKFLDGIAAKKNIDLEKELIKNKMLKKKNRSFRKRLEEQIYEEMFGKEKDKEN